MEATGVSIHELMNSINFCTWRNNQETHTVSFESGGHFFLTDMFGMCPTFVLRLAGQLLRAARASLLLQGLFGRTDGVTYEWQCSELLKSS